MRRWLRQYRFTFRLLMAYGNTPAVSAWRALFHTGRVYLSPKMGWRVRARR